MSDMAEGRTTVRRRLRNLALGAVVAGGSLGGIALYASTAHAQPSGNPCTVGTNFIMCHIHAGGGGGGGGGGGTGTINLPNGLGTIHAGGGGGGGGGGGVSLNFTIPFGAPMAP